jgi:hypothetical protein
MLACWATWGCGPGDASSDPAARDGAADVGAGDAGPSDARASDGNPTDSKTSDASDAAKDAGQEPPLPVSSFSVEVWTWDQTSDTCSYSNNGNPFWDWMAVGREPDVAGKYPLFLYLHGTGDVADNPVAVSIIDSMAKRGFVAASVAYDSLSGIGAVLADPTQACAVGAKKAACEFGPGEGSAVTKLCARAKADCSRGIVLAGHSQGSWLAILAKDVDSRVRAVWGLGAGIHQEVTVDLGGTSIKVASDLGACLPPEARTLPADRLRVVDGESEYVYGTNLQKDVRELTAQDCAPGTMECLRANGSGFAFFPDAANEDGRGVSQHCYMANMPGGDCTASTGLNSIWTNGSASYSREPNLAWLRTFVDP